MNWLTKLPGRRQRAQEISEEIRQHIEEKAEELEARGMARDEARSQARREFGNVGLAEEDSRAEWGWPSLDNFLMDMRYGIRQLAKNPVFTTIAVLTLALGIGANTAIFSLTDALMLRSLPVRDPGQLVELLHQYPGEQAFNGFSWDAYQLMRDQNNVFSSLIVDSPDFFRVRGRELKTQKVLGGFVSGDFFETLGIGAAKGRLIGPEDNNMDHPSAVAVASWSFWKTRFNLDPAIVGKQVVVNESAVTMVGVAEPGFSGLRAGMNQDVWLPVSMERVVHQSELGWGSLGLVGRLKPSVSFEQARAEMAVLFQSAIQAPGVGPFVREMKFRMEPAGSGLSTSIRQMLATPLLVLIGIVNLLLLIVCTNLASLLMARATSRQQEMAVRVCLGAGRARLLRQALTESLLLSGGGAIIGIFLAYFGGRGLMRVVTSGRAIVGLPVDVDALTRPDLHVLLFTGAVALFTALLFGAAPALRASGTHPLSALQQTARTGESRSRRLFGKTLVVSQVALSVVLLSLAALFIGYVSNLRSADLGFRSDHLLLVTLDPSQSAYSPKEMTRLSQELLRQLEVIPGVSSAAFSGMTPMQGPGASSYAVAEGHPENRRAVSINWATPNYFKTYGTPLAAGRDFSSQDEGRAPVAILNESMARDLFGDRSPLGGHVTLNHATGHGDDQTYEIVGVAGDAKYNDLHEAAPRTIYLDAFEQDRISNQLSLRTQIDPEATATAVRQKVASVMKGVSIVRVRTMTDQVDASIVPERVIATLSEWFGVLGALLAAIGLYGLLAYRVSRRTRELGVRMALGARRSDLMRMVLREALGMVGAGVVIGIPLAVWGRKVAATLISNLPTGSETPIILGALAMVAVALLACWIPARRAMRVDPIEALRYE